jgi:glycosyltransferase involved in cell wall biosynthesis
MKGGISKTALAHHWLVVERGGEKVLKILCDLYKDAPIYTLVKRKSFNPEWLANRTVYESYFRFALFSSAYFRSLLPIFPCMIKSIGKLPSDVGVLLSSDASLIKGLRHSENLIHFCYCHSPPRYLWELSHLYFNNTIVGRFKKWFFNLQVESLKNYDFECARNVTYFIANSHFVSERIRKYYNRESVVIYPPVSIDDFTFCSEKEDYFLVVSELVPYKRVDLVIEAFGLLKEKLIVVGGGPEFDNLNIKASDNVRMLGRVDASSLTNLYAKAKALIFPGIEDFGITPLEAQASGTPVIAFRKGGCLETIVDSQTGLFFDSQTVECLLEAIEKFRSSNFDPEKCLENAKRFSVDRFKKEVLEFVNSKTGENMEKT